VKPYYITPLSSKDVNIVLKFIKNNIRGIIILKLLLDELFVLSFQEVT